MGNKYMTFINAKLLQAVVWNIFLCTYAGVYDVSIGRDFTSNIEKYQALLVQKNKVTIMDRKKKT